MDLKNIENLTILCYAAKNNSARILATLIKDYGMDPNQVINRTSYSSIFFDDTPLGFALHYGKCLPVFTLRCAGAQLSEREKKKDVQTNLSCLIGLKTDFDRDALLEALKQESLTPWDPNTIGWHDSTALINAVQKGCLPCIRLLLKTKEPTRTKKIYGEKQLCIML